MAFENKVQRILIDFPIPVDVTRFMGVIEAAVSGICKENAPEGCSMWPAEHGFLVTQMPITKEDDDNGVEMKFDESTYHIGVAIKEKETHRPPRDTRRATWPEDERAL